MTKSHTPFQQAVDAACKREGILAPAKFNKFGIGTRESRTAQGIVFDSTLEMRHYLQLKRMEAAGGIDDLRRQVVYHLYVKGIHVCRYLADFTYLDLSSGKQVVADAKGVRTELYILKKKMMAAEYGIDILELTKGDLR